MQILENYEQTIMHMLTDPKMHDADAEAVVRVGAQAATYGAAATSVVGLGLSIPEWAALISMTVAVLGFIIQLLLAVRLFYRDAHERRIEREAAEKERAAARHERHIVEKERAQRLKNEGAREAGE